MCILAKILPTANLTARFSCQTSSRCCTSLVLVIPKMCRGNDLLSTNSDVKKNSEKNVTSIGWTKNEVSCKKTETGSILPVAMIDLSSVGSNWSKVFLIPLNCSEGNEPNLKNSQLAKASNLYSTSDLEYQGTNIENFDLLADIANKSLQQLVVTKTQHTKDFNTKSENIDEASNKIDGSKLKLKELPWNKNNPYNKISSDLANSFPIVLPKKSFSTAWRQRSISDVKSYGSQTLTGSGRSKFNPNYEYPYLSKLFGTDNSLMRSDAYNQSLIEASKRRAALEECKAIIQRYKNVVVKRPQVMSIKGCVSPIKNVHVLKSSSKSSNKSSSKSSNKSSGKSSSKSSIKSSKSRSSSSKIKKQADGGCKKDDPCRPPKHTDVCTEELEKLERLKEMNIKKKKNKDGCKSPKCIKDECNQPIKKCKSDTNQKKPTGDVKKTPKKKMDRKSYELIRKTSTDCVCQHCKSGKKTGAKKDKSDSSGKSKGQKPKHPCVDDEPKDYKPKCNEDPCKKDKPCDDKKPSSGKKDVPCKKKVKEEPCKKDKKHESPCKKNDPSGGSKPKDPCKKKDPSGGSKPKDPCKKKDPSGGCKQKEDPCKKKDPSGGSKPKDPCKKKDPSGGSKPKEDPCKKKKDPCGGSKPKVDPCKKKDPSGGSKPKGDPCKKDPSGGSKPKGDPCKKKDPSGGSKPKEDPCKKKKDPCGGSKTKIDPCKKDKKTDDPCKKKDPCGSKKPKDSPCKQDKKQEDPCKKKDPCGGSKPKDDPCKKQSPCKKASEDSGKNKKESAGSPSKPKMQKASSLSDSTKKPICYTKAKRRETKPNCKPTKKGFSTFAGATGNINFSLATLPSLTNMGSYNLGLVRHFSSKRKGKKEPKTLEQLGKISRCRSVGTTWPKHRKTITNPHPKDGLRHCFQTYDMDCKRLCKDPRLTGCKKYAFLQSTEDQKRKSYNSKMFKL